MATPIIVPAVLTADVNELKASMEKYASFAKRIQVDVSDGTLTASKTVGLEGIVVPQGVAVDVHLMSNEPTKYVEPLVKLKPSLVIVHAEAQGDIAAMLAALRQAGIKTGVAFLKQTYPGSYKAYLDVADHALIFAGELGAQGGTADLLQVEKARIIREMRKDIEIGWDGGANMSNVRTIFQGGITVINVGSALKNVTDQAGEYNALLAEAEKLGVM